MLCRHKPESATSAYEVLGGQPWRSRCCNGPKGKQCVYVHELRHLRFPLRDPSGRGYRDSRFFEEKVCIYLGQQHAFDIEDLLQHYVHGVPVTELPSWYFMKVWVERGFPVDFPLMRDTWDFGYVQLKEEWLRYIGMKRLPFETEWLRDRLAQRRKYLFMKRLVPIVPPIFFSPIGVQEPWEAQQEALVEDAPEEADVEQVVEADEEEAPLHAEASDDVVSRNEQAVQHDEALDEEQEDVEYDDYERWRRLKVAQIVRLKRRRGRTETEHRSAFRGLRRRLVGR